MTITSVIVGDFNLDYNQKLNPGYSHARQFGYLNELLNAKNFGAASKIQHMRKTSFHYMEIKPRSYLPI